MRADSNSIIVYERDDAEDWPSPWRTSDDTERLGFVLAGVPMPGAWATLGRCRTTPSDLFFLGRGDDPRPAKAICRLCPVVNECREYAIPHRDLQGIWGGLAPRERERIRVERATGATPASTYLPAHSEEAHHSEPGALTAVLEQLIAHPGEWARVAVYAARGSAHSTASLLRTGRRPVPPGTWEFEGRYLDDGDGSALYARYTPTPARAAG